MKKIFILLLMLCVGYTNAQEKVQPQLEKKGDLTLVTYFHDNGEVEQSGAFNANGKLQGEWISYDSDGNKVALGNYDNGQKVGKWFFWNGDSLKEVDYANSKIVSVHQWDNRTKLAIN